MNAIVVRALRTEDYPRWLPLWDGYNAFYGRSGATALPAAVTATTWSRFFDAHEPMHALVAERDDELLGLTHFLFHRSTTQVAPVCYLRDLFTVDGARGQGVGRALVEAVYAHAAAVEAGQVYWQTHESNTNAMRLYDKIAERSGFLVYRKFL